MDFTILINKEKKNMGGNFVIREDPPSGFSTFFFVPAIKR